MSNTALSDAIRQRRLALGLTQEDIESRSGIDQSYLSQIERGRIRRPSRENLMVLADVLQFDYAFLLQIADYSAGVISISDADVERLAQAVVDRLALKMPA